jgi:hypothetical protein
MRTLGALFVIAACSTRPQQQPAPQQPAQGQVVTEVGFVAIEPGGGGPPSADQPAHIKLRLGHYSNPKRGIGVTIDLTERTENIADIDPAKLRFDGEQTVYRLKGQPGARGRIDYMRDRNRVMLHVWDDGRMGVYVPDPDGGPASEMIELARDADADPL